MRFLNMLTRCLFLIIPFCVISCTKNKNQDLSSIKIALSSMPATLDPRKATDATGMRLVNLIFQSLVKVDPNLEVQGDAAESWSFDKNVYEFLLKPGLRFHNGNLIKKEDIEFSVEQFKSTESPFSSAFSGIKSVSVDGKDGKYRVRLTVTSYSAKFLSSDLPVLKILPKEEVLKSGTRFGESPVGSGPLRFVSQGLSQLDLERFPKLEITSNKPNLFEFKVIKDDFTRSQKLIKGELDAAIAELPADLVVKLQENNKEQVQVVTYPGLSMTYLLLNLKDKNLKDKEVRKALSQAIDRQEIIKYKLMNLGIEATSILTPNNPSFNGTLKNPSFDLEAAKAILKKVGTLSLKTSSNPTAVDHGKVLANQLEKAGLKIKLESFEWGTFYNDIKSGNFQLATMKWVGAFDPDIYRIAFHSSEVSPGRNRSHYINPTFDKLVESAHQIQNGKERLQTYQKIQDIIFSDFVILPLWYETQSAVLSADLTGFVPSPLSDYSGLLNVERKTP